MTVKTPIEIVREREQEVFDICKFGTPEMCQIAERQHTLMEDMAQMRTDFSAFQDAMAIFIEIMTSAKVLYKIAKGIGKMLRWTAITLGAAAIVWGIITDWFVGILLGIG